MNLINKTDGEIYINDKLSCVNDEKLNNIIGYLPSEIHLYQNMSVNEMIEYSASFYKENLKSRIDYLCSKFKIERKKKIYELSLGNLKKLGIVLAFMHNPKVLILDEATNGLDPLMQEVFYDFINEEKQKGKTIFFSTHNLSEIKKICDRFGIIKDGKLIKISDVKNISDDIFFTVTIYSNEMKKIKIKSNIISKDENHIKFIFNGNIKELLNTLTNINILKLLIEEPSVEELFIHYYK